MHQVFLHDLLRIFRVDETVPDSLWIHHQHCGMLALVEASGRVHSDLMLQTGFFYGIFQSSTKLFAMLIGATGARRRLVTFIQTDEEMVFVVWHRKIRCRFPPRPQPRLGSVSETIGVYGI
jgi:hypothetical protein